MSKTSGLDFDNGYRLSGVSGILPFSHRQRQRSSAGRESWMRSKGDENEQTRRRRGLDGRAPRYPVDEFPFLFSFLRRTRSRSSYCFSRSVRSNGQVGLGTVDKHLHAWSGIGTFAQAFCFFFCIGFLHLPA